MGAWSEGGGLSSLGVGVWSGGRQTPPPPPPRSLLPRSVRTLLECILVHFFIDTVDFLHLNFDVLVQLHKRKSSGNQSLENQTMEFLFKSTCLQNQNVRESNEGFLSLPGEHIKQRLHRFR